MLWLQSNEKHDCVARYEQKDGSLRKFSREELGGGVPAVTDGFFSELQDRVFLLFKSKGCLYFQVGDKRFMLDEQTVIDVSGPREKRELSLKHRGEIVFETEYSLTSPALSEDDPTAFADEEDFDFGLFVSNISKNPGRRAVLLE